MTPEHFAFMQHNELVKLRADVNAQRLAFRLMLGVMEDRGFITAAAMADRLRAEADTFEAIAEAESLTDPGKHIWSETSCAALRELADLTSPPSQSAPTAARTWSPVVHEGTKPS